MLGEIYNQPPEVREAKTGAQPKETRDEIQRLLGEVRNQEEKDKRKKGKEINEKLNALSLQERWFVYSELTREERFDIMDTQGLPLDRELFASIPNIEPCIDRLRQGDIKGNEKGENHGMSHFEDAVVIGSTLVELLSVPEIEKAIDKDALITFAKNTYELGGVEEDAIWEEIKKRVFSYALFHDAGKVLDHEGQSSEIVADLYNVRNTGQYFTRDGYKKPITNTLDKKNTPPNFPLIGKVLIDVFGTKDGVGHTILHPEDGEGERIISEEHKDQFFGLLEIMQNYLGRRGEAGNLTKDSSMQDILIALNEYTMREFYDYHPSGSLAILSNEDGGPAGGDEMHRQLAVLHHVLQTREGDGDKYIQTPILKEYIGLTALFEIVDKLSAYCMRPAMPGQNKQEMGSFGVTFEGGVSATIMSNTKGMFCEKESQNDYLAMAKQLQEVFSSHKGVLGICQRNFGFDAS